MKNLFVLFCTLALSVALSAQTKVPSGTVIPLILETQLDVAKSTAGQVIVAKVAQKVPLYDGEAIKAGTRVTGEVIGVTAPENSQPAAITLRFGELNDGKTSTPLLLHLRALASPGQVEAAQESTSGLDRGSEPPWSQTTVQIGGDVVYRGGGPVAHGIETVGTPVDDGVLSRVSPSPGTSCRGAIDGNNNPQALWLFSSDACGAYGYDVSIAHAGQTGPTDRIILRSTNGGKFKIQRGSGLLLRVEEQSDPAVQAGN